MSSKNESNLVELSCAFLLNDMFLNDSITHNNKNQGIIKLKDDTYKLMFIDHIPRCNGIFSYFDKDKYLEYSPRTNFNKYFSNKYSESNLCYSAELMFENFKKFELTKKVCNRLLISADDYLSIYDAISKAKLEILALIDNYEYKFSKPKGQNISSQEVITKFADSCTAKVRNFEKTKFAELGFE